MPALIRVPRGQYPRKKVIIKDKETKQEAKSFVNLLKQLKDEISELDKTYQLINENYNNIITNNDSESELNKFHYCQLMDHTLIIKSYSQELENICKQFKKEFDNIIAIGKEPTDLRILLIEADIHYYWYMKFMKDQQQHFIATIFLLLDLVDVPHNAKVKIILSCLQNKRFDVASALLQRPNFELPDVLAVCKILDAKRKINEINKKIAKLEQQKTQPANFKKKIGALRSTINDLIKLRPDELTNTLTRSVSQLILQWIRNWTEDNLKYTLMQFPMEPWREISDIVHPNPKDFKLPCFLPCVYGEPPPKDSDIEIGLQLKKNPQLSEDELIQSIQKYKLPFNFIRKNFSELLTNNVKKELSTYMELDTMIWWYEELSCPEIEAACLSKFKKGEVPKFTYGKMVERLMYFNSIKSPIYQILLPLAESCMTNYTIPLDTPLAVFGDKSGSMQKAIEVSTIIASLMSTIGRARLSFFDRADNRSPLLPKTIKDVILVSKLVKAKGGTSPAASLEVLYLLRIPVAALLVVTDEDETTDSPILEMRFDPLFRKYREEVSPNVRLILVSILQQQDPGKMFSELKDLTAIEQVRIQESRPDLTKLDSLLGQLASSAKPFKDSISATILALKMLPLPDFVNSVALYSAYGRSYPLKIVEIILNKMVGNPNPNREDVLNCLDLVQTCIETLHKTMSTMCLRNCGLESHIGISCSKAFENKSEVRLKIVEKKRSEAEPTRRHTTASTKVRHRKDTQTAQTYFRQTAEDPKHPTLEQLSIQLHSMRQELSQSDDNKLPTMIQKLSMMAQSWEEHYINLYPVSVPFDSHKGILHTLDPGIRRIIYEFCGEKEQSILSAVNTDWKRLGCEFQFDKIIKPHEKNIWYR